MGLVALADVAGEIIADGIIEEEPVTAAAVSVDTVPMVPAAVNGVPPLLLADVVAAETWLFPLRVDVEGHNVHWYVVGGHPGSFNPE